VRPQDEGLTAAESHSGLECVSRSLPAKSLVTYPRANFFSVLANIEFSIFSDLGLSSLVWMSRIPKPDDAVIMELMVSVVVDEAVQGVMGGGDRGVEGDRGHFNRGLDISSGGTWPGEDSPLRGESIDRRDAEEPFFIKDLSLETGPCEKLRRKPGESVVGVVGVNKPFGGTTDGSW
jgi:hypothetical protein